MKALLSCMTSIYLWVVGITLGGILACGVLSAPVIFNASDYLSKAGITDLYMTRYASGVLMTQIFVRCSYALNAVAIFVLVYELLAFNASSKKSLFLLAVGAFSVVLIFLFTLYYTPSIVAMQQEGVASTSTEEFESIHTQSEMVFVILFVALSAGFLWRVFMLKMDTPSAPKKARTTRK